MLGLAYKVLRLVTGKSKSSWLLPSVGMLGIKLLRKLFAKKELVDLSKTKPGDKFVIEHLPITHSKQMKQMKKDKKSQKKSKRKVFK